MKRWLYSLELARPIAAPNLPFWVGELGICADTTIQGRAIRGKLTRLHRYGPTLAAAVSVPPRLRIARPHQDRKES